MGMKGMGAEVGVARETQVDGSRETTHSHLVMGPIFVPVEVVIEVSLRLLFSRDDSMIEGNIVDKFNAGLSSSGQKLYTVF